MGFRDDRLGIRERRQKEKELGPGWNVDRKGRITRNKNPGSPQDAEVPPGYQLKEGSSNVLEKIPTSQVGRTDAGPLVERTPEQQAKEDKIAADKKAAEDKIAADAAEAARFKAEHTNLLKEGTGEVAFGEQGKELLKPSKQSEVYDSAFKDTTGLAKNQADAADAMKAGAAGGSQGQQAYDQMVGSGATRDPQMVDAAWKNMQEMVPESLDKYYDLAFAKDQRRINQAAAARGRFGSTTTMRTLQESANTLSAQQAKDEYTYDIERAKAMNSLATEGTRAKADWMTSMGDLAFNAADESREYGVAAAEVSRNAQLAQVDEAKAKVMAAMGIDQTEDANIVSYMDAAFASQDARENRITIEPKMMLDQMRLMAEIYANAGGNDGTSAVMQSDAYKAAKTDEERSQVIADYQNQQMASFIDQFNGMLGKSSSSGAPSYSSGAPPATTPGEGATATNAVSPPTAVINDGVPTTP